MYWLPRCSPSCAGTVQGIYDGIKTIADALGLPDAGQTLIARMQRRIDAVSNEVREKPTPTVVMLEWIDPIFSMGNWGPELVEAANGRVLLGEKGQHSQAIPWDRVREADPDVLIIAPCGFNLDRTQRSCPFWNPCPAGLSFAQFGPERSPSLMGTFISIAGNHDRGDSGNHRRDTPWASNSHRR